MDLFASLGIVVEEVKKDAVHKPEPKKQKDTSTKVGKTQSAKQSIKPAYSGNKANTQADITRMLVGFDWHVDYATHTFSVLDLSRLLVEMDDSHPIDAVKEALWARVPQEVKDELEKARQARAEAELLAAAGTPEQAQADIPIETEEHNEEPENADDLTYDEEEGEVKVSSPKASAPAAAVKPNRPEDIVVQEGELTVDMLRQALSLKYMEFVSEEAVQWRVNMDAKRLTPIISIGKFGGVTK